MFACVLAVAILCELLVIVRLARALSDERASIVVAECAVKPQCREQVAKLGRELELLRGPARERGMNWPWLGNFVGWWAVAIACLCARDWWLLLAWPTLGVAQHAIGSLGHDALHSQVHPRRRVNDAFAAACLWPLGFFVGRWRVWHMRHHAMLGQPGRDPEVMLKLRHDERWFRRGQWMRDVTGLAADEMPQFWLDVNRGRLWSAAGLPIYLGASLILAGGWFPLALWIVALLTTQTAVFRARARLEHDIRDMAKTIERDRASFLVRMLVMPGAAWRHAEHHRTPARRL